MSKCCACGYECNDPACETHRMTKEQRAVIDAVEDAVNGNTWNPLTKLEYAIRALRKSRKPKPRYRTQLAIRDHVTPWAVMEAGPNGIEITDSRWPTRGAAKSRCAALNAKP